jgi:hypothetical protein
VTTGMKFRCQDIRNAGLVLVPVTSPDYEPLLRDIQHRIENPVPEVAALQPRLREILLGKIDPARRATSSILLNHSGKSIAMMELVWLYEDANGRTCAKVRQEIVGKRILLSFSPVATICSVADQKIEAYWKAILPGSKRYVGEDGMAGDNTDVRLPLPGEARRVGATSSNRGTSGGGTPHQDSIRSVTMELDGAFFTDGEFVGSDRYGLWESVTTEAKMRMDAGKAARDGKARGLAAPAILDEVAKFFGPVRDRSGLTFSAPSFPTEIAAMNGRTQQQRLAREFQNLRQTAGDERTVYLLAAQAETRPPDFRKR